MTKQGKSIEPAVLGEGPMANSIQGGHVAMVEGLPFPRWVVAIESTTAQGPRSGVIVDLVHRSIGRWFLVSPRDALVSMASCGTRLGGMHLCIPTIYRLDGGHLEHDLQLDMIAPIVDHLLEWWEHRDGPRPSAGGHDNPDDFESPIEDDEEGDLGHAKIDRRAFAMLVDLHAGSTATETDKGKWIVRNSSHSDKDRENNDEDAELKEGGREYAGSAGYQLAHWGLASWTSYSTLVITPSGRGLAQKHGHAAGVAKGIWDKEIPVGKSPDVLIVDHEIDEPRELDVPCEGTLHVDRKHDGWGRNGGSINLRFDGEMEGIVLEMSVAKALVEQLAPALIKGPVNKVRIEGQRSRYGKATHSVIAIGGGKVLIEAQSVSRDARYRITLDATKTKLFRAIVREATKRNAEGGALEEVTIWKTIKEALYGAVDWG